MDNKGREDLLKLAPYLVLYVEDFEKAIRDLPEDKQVELLDKVYNIIQETLSMSRDILHSIVKDIKNESKSTGLDAS